MKTANTGNTAQTALVPNFIDKHGQWAACGKDGGQVELHLVTDRVGDNSSKGLAGR